MENKISYDEIDLVTPYPIMLIEELELTTELGEHTAFTVRAIVDTDSWRGVDYFLASTRQEDEIKLYLKGEERQLLFVGLPASLELEVQNDVYILNISCYSATYRMDQEKRTFTYQDAEMNCETLLQRISARYQGGYLNPNGENQKTRRMYLQYQETDWQFLKRVAADQGTVIAADATTGNANYFFGLPDGKRGIKLAAKTLQYRTNIESRDCFANAVYEAESEQLLKLGDRVTYQRKELVVVGSTHRMEQGAILNYYRLMRPFDIKQPPYCNEAIGGIALEGTVIDVAQDCVKVHFAIDAAQDVKTARWIPYAGESNQVCYNMPHKNEHILVHFPSADEEQAITMSTIRGTGGGLSDTPSMSKPTEKCMETKWGKTMALHEESIDFHTPLIQALFLEDSIEIISNDRIEITSETELNIGKSELESEEGGEIEETAQISIEAEELLSFVVTSTRTGLELEENTDMYNIFRIDSEGTNKATYPTITSEGMQAGQATTEQIAAEQAVAEQAAAEESEKGSLWKRIGKGALKAAAGLAIGIAVIFAAPVILTASTAVAIAGGILAAGSFLIGTSLFCEGYNDIELGVRGYDEEEVPSTDGMLGLTGQREEFIQGCVTLASLVLTGAQLYYAAAGMLSYGTYLLNERISRSELKIWPTSSYDIVGANSDGTAIMGRVWDWTNVPAIPYVLAPAAPAMALVGDVQVASVIDDGLARMSGGGSGGSGGNVPSGGSEQSINPNEIRFSQSSVNGAEEITASMKADGWVGDPIDVVKMPDGSYTTIDNTRVAAARQAGIDVKANVHNYDDLLSIDQIDRFITKKGTPTTWGEAIELRIGKQNAGFRNTYPSGSFEMPKLNE